MTFCCEHTKKAYDLILKASGTLDWSENFGTGDYVVGFLTLGLSSNISQSGSIDEAQSRMRRARSDLSDAQREMNSCSCSNYDELLDKNNDLRGENGRLKEECKSIRDNRERERLNSVQDNMRLKGNLDVANHNIENLTKSLEDTRSELGLVRVEKQNQLGELNEKKIQLTTLQLESGERNSMLQEKEREIERKNEEIKNLCSQKGLTQEELLTEKFRSEQVNLELFSTQLGINLEQIHNLGKYYEELLVARKNRNSVNVHRENISRVKQYLIEWGVNIINIQEICRKCERIAELNWELEQIQQQYQTRQEVPTN